MSVTSNNQIDLFNVLSNALVYGIYNRKSKYSNLKDLYKLNVQTRQSLLNMIRLGNLQFMTDFGFLMNLPPELLIKVIDNLDTKERLDVCRTSTSSQRWCKEWSKVIIGDDFLELIEDSDIDVKSVRYAIEELGYLTRKDIDIESILDAVSESTNVEMLRLFLTHPAIDVNKISPESLKYLINLIMVDRFFVYEDEREDDNNTADINALNILLIEAYNKIKDTTIIVYILERLGNIGNDEQILPILEYIRDNYNIAIKYGNNNYYGEDSFSFPGIPEELEFWGESSPFVVNFIKKNLLEKSWGK